MFEYKLKSPCGEIVYATKTAETPAQAWNTIRVDMLNCVAILYVHVKAGLPVLNSEKIISNLYKEEDVKFYMDSKSPEANWVPLFMGCTNDKITDVEIKKMLLQKYYND